MGEFKWTFNDHLDLWPIPLQFINDMVPQTSTHLVILLLCKFICSNSHIFRNVLISQSTFTFKFLCFYYISEKGYESVTITNLKSSRQQTKQNEYYNIFTVNFFSAQASQCPKKSSGDCIIHIHFGIKTNMLT